VGVSISLACDGTEYRAASFFCAIRNNTVSVWFGWFGPFRERVGGLFLVEWKLNYESVTLRRMAAAVLLIDLSSSCLRLCGYLQTQLRATATLAAAFGMVNARLVAYGVLPVLLQFY